MCIRLNEKTIIMATVNRPMARKARMSGGLPLGPNMPLPVVGVWLELGLFVELGLCVARGVVVLMMVPRFGG